MAMCKFLWSMQEAKFRWFTPLLALILSNREPDRICLSPTLKNLGRTFAACHSATNVRLDQSPEVYERPDVSACWVTVTTPKPLAPKPLAPNPLTPYGGYTAAQIQGGRLR